LIGWHVLRSEGAEFLHVFGPRSFQFFHFGL
jgi:hypothetical protein